MNDSTFFYIMVIKAESTDFDIKNVLDRVAEAIMGEGAKVVTVLPDPVKARLGQEKPLYKIRVIKESIKRNENNQSVGMANPGDEYFVYKEFDAGSEYKTRILISEPFMPVVHIYKPNTEKAT